jgi:hypothetical protein
MAFPHPTSRKDNHGKGDIRNHGGVIWKFFERTVNITDYRFAKDGAIERRIERLVASFMVGCATWCCRANCARPSAKCSTPSRKVRPRSNAPTVNAKRERLLQTRSGNCIAAGAAIRRAAQLRKRGAPHRKSAGARDAPLPANARSGQCGPDVRDERRLGPGPVAYLTWHQVLRD